ncbi:MAG TPA: PorV/PorQ family protein [Bacteroidota bacterium]
MKLSKSVLTAAVLALAVVLVVQHAVAGSGRRAGTAGAQELLIPVGGAGMALSGSFTPTVTGVEAMYWNPAGLSLLSGSAELMFSHMNYLAAIGVEYAAAGAKMGESSVVGISVQSLDFGNIPVTTVDLPDGTGETYSPTFLTIGLTYSRMMTDKIAFGATAKLISESILRQTATGVAFDFGLQYRSSISGLAFGVTLKNLGPTMKFGGPDLESKVQLPGTEPGSQPRALSTLAQEFELPSTLDFGISYERQLQANLTTRLSTTFEHHNYSYDNIKLGVEFGYQSMVFVRGGYLLSADTPEDEKVYTFTVGGGVHFNMAENLTFSLDYAFRQAEFFGDNQVFALKVGL